MKLVAGLLAALMAFAAQVPRKAPELAVQMPGNQQWLLSQHRGKVVCIQFLLTTCPHCQHASQLINKLVAEYGSKGFTAVGIAFNDMAQMLVPDYKKNFSPIVPVGWATRDTVTSFLQHDPNLRLSVPQIVFVDRKGMIRYQSLPENDNVAATEANLRKWITTLLAEPAPATARPTSSRRRAEKTS